MATRLVRMLTVAAGAAFVAYPGDHLRVDAVVAAQLVEVGSAEYVDPEPLAESASADAAEFRDSGESGPEAAVLMTRAKAVLPRARARRQASVSQEA